MTVRAQELITPGRTVAAEHVNFRIGLFQFVFEIMKQIEHTWIIMADISRSTVSQVLVQPSQCLREVTVTPPIDNIEPFAGVYMQ